MTLTNAQSVKYFMQLMGQETPSVPRQLTPSEWELRHKLIKEEAKELLDAWLDGDMPGFLDACVDLVYVTIGTALDAGMPFDEAFEAVHRANMQKAPKCEACYGFGYRIVDAAAGSYRDDCEKCAGVGRIVLRRDDGKVMKPVGWQAPDIAAILEGKKDAASASSSAQH